MKKNKYITPICCEKVKTTFAVRLGLYSEDTPYGEWKDIKPKWYITGIQYYSDLDFPLKVEVDKCPFCSTVLPDIKKTKKRLKITEGDEEYCDTCGERNMCCGCLPPEFRWEIVE